MHPLIYLQAQILHCPLVKKDEEAPNHAQHRLGFAWE
jgi:hypothetical protein